MHRIRALIVILVGGAGVAVSGLLLFSIFSNDDSDIGGSMATGDAITMQIVTGTISTGTTNTGVDTGTPIRTGTQTTGIVQSIMTIAMPERLYDDEFAALLTQFEQDNNIRIQKRLSEDIYSHQQVLDNEFINTNTLDLALIPSDWTETYKSQGLALDIPASSRGVFHVLLYDLFIDPVATYIPFAIDPMVAIGRDGRWDDRQEMTIGRLYTRSLTNNARAEIMPLLIGLDNNDRTLLEKGRESYPSQYLTVSHLIKDIVSNNDSVGLEQLITLANSTVTTSWKYNTMRTRTTQQAQITPGCTLHPIGCLLASRRGQFALTTMGDVMRWATQLPSFDIENFKLYPMLRTDEEYPVRVRGRYINRDSQYRQLAGRVMNTYIQTYQSQTPTADSLLVSPFIVQQDIQRQNKKRDFIRQREFDRTPLIGASDDQIRFVDQLGRDILFEQDIDPTLWLYQKRNTIGR